MIIMRITISGTVGSGKSTVARIVADKLGYKYHSIGELMRKIAMERGIHLSELSKVAEKDKSVDEELDSMQKDLHKKDNFVMDSRLGFHFIPNSYKIFIMAEEGESAKRIFNANRESEKYKNLEEAKEHVINRMASEKKRYNQFYGINFNDKKNFDLVIDSTHISAEEVVERIMKKIGKIDAQK
jgi:CMP/dCMP kinase